MKRLKTIWTAVEGQRSDVSGSEDTMGEDGSGVHSVATKQEQMHLASIHCIPVEEEGYTRNNPAVQGAWIDPS